MDINDVVDRAKAYARDLFGPEGLVDPRLEEIEHDLGAGVWDVTLAMLRPLPLDRLGGLSEQLAAPRGETRPGARIYRVVRLRDQDGGLVSIKMREELA